MPVTTSRSSGWLLLAAFAAVFVFASPAAAEFFSLPTGPSEKADEVAVPRGDSGTIPAGVTVLADREFQAALESQIGKARSEITLCAHQFAAGDALANRPRAVADRLVEAAGRGVKVEVILEVGRESAAATRINRAAARMLGRRGVKVYGDNSGTTVHARFIVIDRRFVFIGSHDLTENSLGQYREVSLLLDSPSLALALLGQVDSYRPMPYAEAPPRPPAKRTSRPRSTRSR